MAAAFGTPMSYRNTKANVDIMVSQSSESVAPPSIEVDSRQPKQYPDPRKKLSLPLTQRRVGVKQSPSFHLPTSSIGQGRGNNSASRGRGSSFRNASSRNKLQGSINGSINQGE